MQTGWAIAQEMAPIDIFYYERKPFQYRNSEGKPAGFIVDVTQQVFQSAGIPVNWQLRPLNRVLKSIAEEHIPSCAPGWFKKADREVYSNYSHPIYLDKPIVGFSKASFPVTANVSAKELFSRSDVHLLVNHSLVYGEYLDHLVNSLPENQVEWSSATFLQFAKMLSRGQANLLLLTQEEIDLILEEDALSKNDFKIIKFSEVTYREPRFILCSKEVPDRVMKKLNDAIDAVVQLK